MVIPEHSIAVLPFINLSAGKNQEYFSDGLAEELLNVLSKVPGLQVAARTSAFSFKGHAVDVRTIGRQLLVAHVLEGSVRMVGNHLRVTAQLVRTDKGYQIWSETYDRELGDVFRIQDEISAAVVKALKVSLLGSAAPRSAGTQSTDAYLVFLQGRSKMASDRLADTQGAAQDFTRVLKLDPNYAPAYVELATAKLRFAEFDVTENRLADFEAAKAEAKVLIEQALTLDPKNAQAYIERGNLRAYSDPQGAESDFRRGIALNPNSARGYLALAVAALRGPEAARRSPRHASACPPARPADAEVRPAARQGALLPAQRFGRRRRAADRSGGPRSAIFGRAIDAGRAADGGRALCGRRDVLRGGPSSSNPCRNGRAAD